MRVIVDNSIKNSIRVSGYQGIKENNLWHHDTLTQSIKWENTMERRALGKGISALIPGTEIDLSDKAISIPLDQIKPNPLQPREDFNQEAMDELVQSIKEKGIIQPILVRRKADYYELIAGERRWRAANLLNLKEISAIVKNIEDQDSLEVALIENIQRHDLNPIEEARAYRYLIDKFGVTQDRLSEVLGKSRVSIANILRLLKLAPEVQEEMRKGKISFAHGRTLLEIDDHLQQRRLVHEIITNSLSVRELESLVKQHKPRLPRRQSTASGAIDPQLAVLEESLQQSLATKVRIEKNKKRGEIIIEFYSSEDLNRIAHKISDSARQ